MNNYWLIRSLEILENEIILVKPDTTTHTWFKQMPSVLTVICPEQLKFDEFGPKVGVVHHLRYSNYGIEGVLKAPRKYHRYSHYVLYDKIKKPSEPFWVVLRP